MNTRFKLLSLLALGLAVAAPALRADDPKAPPPPPAQQPSRADDFRAQRMKTLDDKLHLTADQKTKIEAIWDKEREQLEALRNDDSLGRHEKRAKFREIFQAGHDQVRAVLTADQQKIFDTLKPERPPRPPRHHRDGDMPPPPPPPDGGQ